MTRNSGQLERNDQKMKQPGRNLQFVIILSIMLVLIFYNSSQAAELNSIPFQPSKKSKVILPQPKLLDIMQGNNQIYLPFLTKPCLGDCYYVDSLSGSDTNSGTSQNQAWRTIQKAADTVVAGDTVYIKAGTYSERVIPQHSGSADNYITYTTYPGDKVTINGTGLSVPRFAGLFHISGKSYIKVSGLRVINSSGAGIFVDTSDHISVENNYTYNTVISGIGVWNSNNIIFDSNEVELACNDGDQESITVANTHDFVVKFNEIHNGGPGTFGGEGFDAKGDSYNGKVYGNHIHHISERLGLYVDAYKGHAYNIEVFDNIIHDNQDGIAVASEAGGLLENIQIYNNIVYNNQQVGLTISECCSKNTDSHPMKDISAINNTFYNNGQDWGGGIRIANSDIQNIDIRNNIVSQNLSFQIKAESTVPLEQLMVTNNLIDGYRGNQGELDGNDSILGDPRFENTLLFDFHLMLDSPAIDQGSSLDAPSDDFDNIKRPQDGDGNGTADIDIGAYEAIR